VSSLLSLLGKPPPPSVSKDIKPHSRTSFTPTLFTALPGLPVSFQYGPTCKAAALKAKSTLFMEAADIGAEIKLKNC
jgi:hypothetical protein